MLNEIHGNRIPGQLRNWKLLELAIGLVLLRFCMHTCGAGLAEVLDSLAEVQPGIIPTNQLECLVLPEVSG